jgi:hypothetical protein
MVSMVLQRVLNHIPLNWAGIALSNKSS